MHKRKFERTPLGTAVKLVLLGALVGTPLVALPAIPAAADTSTIDGRKQTILDVFSTSEVDVGEEDRTNYCKNGMWFANARLEMDVDIADALELIESCNTAPTPSDPLNGPGQAAMFFRWANMDAYVRHADDHYSTTLKNKVAAYFSAAPASPFSGTDNHRVMESVAMYLSVQAFPSMPNASAKLTLATDEINELVENFTSLGMFEFASNNYQSLYIGAFTTLYELAGDSAIRNKARIMLDWLYAGMAHEWLDGYWVTSGSREMYLSPEPAQSASPATQAWLMFGGEDPVLPDTWFAANHYGIPVAASTYEPPQIIIDIANDRSAPVTTLAGADASNFSNPPNGYNRYTYVTDTFGISSYEDGISGVTNFYNIVENNRWKLRWKSEDRGSAFFMKNSAHTADATYLGTLAIRTTPPVPPATIPTIDYYVSQYEQVVQHEGTVVAVYDLPTDGIDDPYIQGPVSQESIYRMEETGGWIYFHAGSIVFGVRIIKSYTWEDPLLLEDYSGTGITWDTLRSSHLKNGVIMEVKPATDYDSPADSGLTDEQRWEAELDRFITDVSTNTTIDATGIDDANPALTFTNLDGDTLFITHNGSRGVNAVPYDYSSWPLLESPFGSQAVDGDLTLTHGSDSCTYDYTNWTTDCWGPENNGPVGGGGDSDLAVHWALDEASGTIAADWSGNSRPGDLSGGLTAGTDSVTGVHGGALELDGADDVVRLDGAPGIAAYPFTLSAWVKTSSSAGEQTIAFVGDHTVDSEYASISVAGGKARITARNGGSAESAEWATSIADGQWHLVTGVFESSTSMKLYVDGTHRATQSVAVSMPDIDRVSAGARDHDSPDAFLTGSIDDVRLYDTLLASNDVAALYTSTDPALALYWPFNAPSGTYATDFSGNGNDGVLLGGLTSGTHSVTGKFGSALTFDGTDDSVRFEGNPVVTYPFTVSGWIKTTASTGNHTIAYLGDSASNTNYLVLGLTNGMARVTARDGSGIYHGAWTTPINDGQWHLVTGVFESSSSMKLYVDGVHRATQAVTVAAPEIDRVSVGLVERLTPADPFSGAIDDVRLFKRALSGTEVAALYVP